jgi:hypothetical protein
MATSVGPDGIDVTGYGWTNQSTTFNTNKSLESYGAPNSALYNAATNNGYVAWSLIPEDAIATVNHAATTVLQLTRVFVPASATVGHVDFNFTTSGTVTVFYAGIYSAAGVLLGSTAESHASISTSAITGLALSSSVNLSGGSFYYVGTTMTWSVQPVMAGSTMASAFVANANLTAATDNTATAGTNATLPSTITMSSNTAIATKLWVGLRA